MADVNPVVIDGREYFLGCLERVVAPGTVYPVFGERPYTVLIPRQQWRPIDMAPYVPEVLDQQRTNACNAFASVQCLHVLRNIAGFRYVKLSAGSLYGQINGGRDAGSYLSDAIQALDKTGVCDTATVPELEWHVRHWPPNWKENAKKYRVLEAWDCPTFDHIGSALQLGFLVNVGILVGNNFTPDGDGWVPDYRGGGGGHALCAVGMTYKQGKGWGVKIVNSWGANWGVNGYAIIPESYFRASPFTDAWAVRGVVYGRNV